MIYSNSKLGITQMSVSEWMSEWVVKSVVYPYHEILPSNKSELPTDI